MKKLILNLLLICTFLFSSGFGLVTDSPAVHRELAKCNNTASFRKVSNLEHKATCETGNNNCGKKQENEQPKPTFREKVTSFFTKLMASIVIFVVNMITRLA